MHVRLWNIRYDRVAMFFLGMALSSTGCEQSALCPIGATSGSADLAVALDDMAIAPPDLAAPWDLAVPRDLAARPDLAVHPDLAAPRDLAVPPDLAARPDLAVPADLAVPRDLAVPPDLAIPPGPRVPAQCLKETTEQPTFEIRWSQGLAVDNDVRIIGKMIVGYQIQWFNGSWSQVYTPGVDDIDWVTNNDGSQRRVWSYFYDHTHRYYTGTDVQEAATNDPRWRQGLSTALDNQIIGKDIASYRILSNASWSQNYTPGIDDVDPMKNQDGSERRMWSHFADQVHRYVTCP